MDIRLRLEEPADYRFVEELTREAFWGLNQPGCDEHLLVHKLRKIRAFVPELDFVAEVQGKIVGNIMYSKAKVVDERGVEHKVLTFGPVSVLPEYQGKGIGKALLEHTIAEARRLGYTAIVFYGHPDYYPRFGFRRAEEFNITTASGTTRDSLMAMPLHEGALCGISGRFYEDPVCQIDPEEAAEFDKDFPPKEKRELEPVDILLEKLAPPAQEAIRERGIKYLTTLTRFSGLEIASWPGIGETAKAIINDVLVKHGYPPKVFNPPKEWCV
ncbi:MAG: GNAT family N-acetyltransferase [Firmicutes bacterium]|nr:GNAT family N-acetyltransferase [Candidatus Fermentithermobacillaceae bacterium]